MKGKISEDDIARVLERYTLETIVAVLQEVGTTSTYKIDWHSLVKMTSSGISCPREYQMLWRHLAYSHSLQEVAKDDSGGPLSDESDLEFELEPSPAITTEENLEAEAYTKVLMTSAKIKNSDIPSIEAPMLINIPKKRLSNDPFGDNQASSSSKNVVIPVLVPKHPMPSITLAGCSDRNGQQPMKKKRKFWTKEEDADLIAAVEVHGEGNWQVILKEYKHDRTSAQLSQRWSILKKRQEKSVNGSSANPYRRLSEAKFISTNEALSLALDTQSSRGTMKANTSASLVVPTNSSDASRLLAQKVPIQSQSATCKKGAVPSKLPLEPPSKLPLELPSAGHINLIQKAALAAGGRMANSSTAASHFKAAQSKNAVHIGRVNSLSVSHGHISKPSPLAKLLPRQSNTIQNKLVASAVPVSGSASNAFQNRSVPPTIPASGSGIVLSQAAASSSNKLPSQIAPSPVALLPPSLSHNLPSASKSANPPSAGKPKSSVNPLEKYKQQP